MNTVAVSDGVVYATGTQHESPDFNCPLSVWSGDGTGFRLLPGRIECDSSEDLAVGPAGILAITSGHATAWTRSGVDWKPHAISPDTTTVSNAHVFAVAGSDDGYVAVGSIGVPQGFPPDDLRGAIWWSADGVTWTRVGTNVPDPRYRQAQFHDVAHSASGWIAVGWQQHPGPDLALSDAVVWTSPDGRHWTPVNRDGNTFEQYADTRIAGTTAGGFAISGTANISTPGTDAAGSPIRDNRYHEDEVLWMGSDPPPTTDGIAQGSMHEIGGPAPGLPKPIAGTLVATGTDGRQHTTTVDVNGRFSITLAPGEYTVEGHSPTYGNGAYTCGANTAPVVVRANAVTDVELYCQIR